MKLIIKQYLASLKERGELDALLPDLLSQMRLNVFSKPRIGTRQDGVDVAATGNLDGKGEKVYLFSIKAGDLTRQTWNGDSIQSLRPSLDSIKDAYIPNRLPDEHRGKDIVICLCFGGDVQESVRPDVEGYIGQNKSDKLIYVQWNGDKLAELILTYFLSEELIPKNVRGYLRKALALLDEPEISYQHFSSLIKYFSNLKKEKDEDYILAIRQINICVWILYAWARDAGNIESAYLCSELALLHGWQITKNYSSKKTKAADAVHYAFNALLNIYLLISSQYTVEKILPHVNKKHGLSNAINTSCNLDINLKLFDVLGRVAMSGIWEYWNLLRGDREDSEALKYRSDVVRNIADSIKHLILNNPVLLLPIKDEQVIDLSMAVMLLLFEGNSDQYIKDWLSELMGRVKFSHMVKDHYPCITNNYVDLIDHPQKNEGYYEEVTSGSVLYPMIAFWSVLLNEDGLYSEVQALKKEYLGHCNFQLWYPDESSEEHFYANRGSHGYVLSNVCIEREKKELLKQIFDEAEQGDYFKNLSIVQIGLWPVILLASRHYRLPVPIYLWKGILESKRIDTKSEKSGDT